MRIDETILGRGEKQFQLIDLMLLIGNRYRAVT